MERAAIAISGGADSVYLLHRFLASLEAGQQPPLLLHMNHRLRGEESDADARFVAGVASDLGLPLEIGIPERGIPVRVSGVEADARRRRYAFLRSTCSKRGVRRILVAHTADDQVETVLMRIFEGAGISGLKGIPASGEGGIERPLLGTWRTEILSFLDSSGIPYRTDSSNADNRFERNWIRNELLPLLVARYGEAVKQRIHALGERFRELDDFIGGAADRWIRRNVKGDPPAFRRDLFSALPSVVRMTILQRLLHAHAGKSPNERLLLALDRSIAGGGPSASIRAGSNLVFRNSYGTVAIVPRDAAAPAHEADAPIPVAGPGRYPFSGNFPVEIRVSLLSPRSVRKGAFRDDQAAWFDLDDLRMPLAVSPLAAGDSLVPFGASGRRKAKEIMIDRKVPRESRWGRAVVRDAAGEILWIPGVARSSLAPVGPGTRQVVRLTSRPL